jgi:hypothetical protein
LERYDDALTGMEGFDGRSDPVDDAHEFVAENVALLEGEYLPVVQVKIRA